MFRHNSTIISIKRKLPQNCSHSPSSSSSSSSFGNIETFVSTRSFERPVALRRRNLEVPWRLRRRRWDFRHLASQFCHTFLQPVHDCAIVLSTPHRLFDIVTLWRLRRHCPQLILQSRYFVPKRRFVILNPNFETFLELIVRIRQSFWKTFRK